MLHTALPLSQMYGELFTVHNTFNVATITFVTQAFRKCAAQLSD